MSCGKDAQKEFEAELGEEWYNGEEKNFCPICGIEISPDWELCEECQAREEAERKEKEAPP